MLWCWKLSLFTTQTSFRIFSLLMLFELQINLITNFQPVQIFRDLALNESHSSPQCWRVLPGSWQLWAEQRQMEWSWGPSYSSLNYILTLGTQGAHFSEVKPVILPYPQNLSLSVKLQSWATQACLFLSL